MKIFLDTGNVEEIVFWFEKGIVDGVTTNPTHLSSEGGNPVNQLRKICDEVYPCPVSAQVTQTEAEAVYHQAKKLAALKENIVVKIPCHIDFFPVIKRLVSEKVTLNITLVASLAQCMAMCKLGVAYISPFVGRLDDIDCSGSELIADAVQMVQYYGFSTRVLAASVRTVPQFHDIIMSGAHVCTLPVSLLEKSLKHPVTTTGMKKFLDDWKKLDIEQFP